MNNIRRSSADRLFDTINVIVLLLVILAIVYPLYFVLIASFSDPMRLYADTAILWPASLSLDSYAELFGRSDVFRGFANSVLYTVVGTSINLVMTILAAYPLSRSSFKGRRIFMFGFIFTMFFQGGLIPLFLVNRQLGILDSIWAMVLPQAINVFYLIIMRTYFQTNIPGELIECSKVDGAGETRILLQIVLPLSAPILFVMALFYGVLHWNAYFNALVYLTDRDKYPLQLVLRDLLIVQQPIVGVADNVAQRVALKEGMKYASVVVSSLPLFIIFPLLSKYFRKGILIGAIKG